MRSDLPDPLQRTFALPGWWSAPEIFEDALVADGVSLHRAGLSARLPTGEEATGAAADACGSPVQRGFFELLEHVCVADAVAARKAAYPIVDGNGHRAGERPGPLVFAESADATRWRYARSNGVALHADFKTAAVRALWELSESDRVLRSWYGQTCPERIPFDVEATPLRASQSYDWRAYSFPAPRGAQFSRGTHVTGVFGLPNRPRVPFVFGFGARRTRDDALEVATREALQRLGFLWGEPIPDRPPAECPMPFFHLESFQLESRHRVIRSWLDGEHAKYGFEFENCEQVGAEVNFVDLTPEWLENGLRVVKAICSDAVPLTFGDAPFARHMPPELRIHPMA